MNSNLPEYQCHKKVRAGQIERITYDSAQDSAVENVQLHLRGGITRTQSKAWFLKHDPEIGGYYVEYEDGYSSYSPRRAFEDGYHLIDTQKERIPSIPFFNTPRDNAVAVEIDTNDPDAVARAIIELANKASVIMIPRTHWNRFAESGATSAFGKYDGIVMESYENVIEGIPCKVFGVPVYTDAFCPGIFLINRPIEYIPK